jgi:dipeptidyl aminopeptidase/acylaminoacyl peptidase
VPDFTADILAATATMRQRPRWSFPARWLPAALVPRLPRMTVRPLPWRTIALLALLGLLLAAAVTVYVGSRPRLPAPFGLATNGLVAYGELGEIWTVDPVSGARTKIVSMTGGNEAPRFSRDGTRVAFLRPVEGGNAIAITEVDGTSLVMSTGAPFVSADTDSIAWSPDGRSVAIVADWGMDRTVYLVDAKSGVVRNLEVPNIDMEPYWRPPDGRQLMYAGITGGDQRRLFIVDVGSSAVAEVPGSRPERGMRPGGWTPDGRRVVVHHFGETRAWTSLLDPETGRESRLPVAYGRVSNDGSQIVGFQMQAGREVLCVMAVPEGPCVPVAEGTDLPDYERGAGTHWSPDDRWIAVYTRTERWILVDPAGGPPMTPPWTENGVETWQRLAL